MDGECIINDQLLLYARTYMNKQVYQVRSEIVEFIRDNDDEVKTLGGIYIKKLQLTFDDYIKRVSTAGTIVDKLMICLLSQMYVVKCGVV